MYLMIAEMTWKLEAEPSSTKSVQPRLMGE